MKRREERERDTLFRIPLLFPSRFFLEENFPNFFGKKDTLVKNTRLLLRKRERRFPVFMSPNQNVSADVQWRRSPIRGNSGHLPLYGESCHEGNIVEFVKTAINQLKERT